MRIRGAILYVICVFESYEIQLHDVRLKEGIRYEHQIPFKIAKHHHCVFFVCLRGGRQGMNKQEKLKAVQERVANEKEQKKRAHDKWQRRQQRIKNAALLGIIIFMHLLFIFTHLRKVGACAFFENVQIRHFVAHCSAIFNVFLI